MNLVTKIKVFAGDIKIAHSIFALPFAIIGILMSGISIPTPQEIFLVFISMISARTFAMGINRALDAEIDRKNQRTSHRAIPSGKVDVSDVTLISLVAAIIFIASAFWLSRMAGFLSVPLLIVLAFYSLMKRISWLTHFYLGLCLGLSPIAVSIALADSASLAVLLLGVSVLFWTAGFDIIYSIQDMSFDQAHSLRSIPSRFGAERAILISRFCFIAMVVALILAGYFARAGIMWHMGVAVISGILFWEQFYVSRNMHALRGAVIDRAFFSANAWVSIVFMAFAVCDYWR